MEEKRCLGCMKKKTQPVCEHCGYDEANANASHQLPAGTVLQEQYLVGRVLGQGGFGITYMGWDLYLDIPVAIKEYYPNGTVMREAAVSMSVSNCTNDEGARFNNNKERFLREAKSLARFSQVPEIVQIKNFFLANNTAYIVMEYVEGITLKQYVKDKGGKLSVEETLSILGPVMETLCKVHKAGLVHRDISPDNIMMLPGGGAKLLDFGAVRDVGAATVNKELTKSTEAILKQGYAPIEQYLNRGALGAWTDVYALCATIYYCLTGEVPQSAPERMLEGESIDWEALIPELSREQVAALDHGMQIRAENRTPSMDQLHTELFAVPEPVAGKPEEEKAAVISKQEKKEPRKKDKDTVRYLDIAVVLSVIAIILIGILVFTNQTASGICGASLTWKLNLNDGVLNIYGSGSMTDYSGEEDNLPPWYEYADKIESVVIGDKVTSIGSFAFSGCEALAQVTFGNELEEIHSHAFWGCAIPELQFPDSLDIIEEGAFAFNPLTNLVFPDELRYIGSCAFACMDTLESVTLGVNTRLNYDTWQGPLFGNGQRITIYGYEATMAEDYAQIMAHEFVLRDPAELGYTHMWHVNELRCGDNVYAFFDIQTGFLKIEGTGDMWDFNGTWMETTGDTPDPSRQLPSWTNFRDDIKAVSIADGVTSIGENAFESCGNLEDIHFGNTVRSIGFQSFLGTAVGEIVLPDSVRFIDFAAFNWCEKLWYVVLPENMPSLEIGAFNACYGLKEFYAGRETVFKTDKSGFNPFCHEGEPDMPMDMTIYGLQNSNAEVFAVQNGIPFVIGARGYKAEAEGQCGDDVWWFVDENTLVIYGTGSTDLYVESEEEYQFQMTVTDEDMPAENIHPYPVGFREYASQIEGVIVLPGVTYIADYFFRGLENLQWVDLGTIEHLGLAALENTALTDVVLPESLTLLRGWNFAGCQKLTSVTIPGNTRVELSIFHDTPNLREVWFGTKVVLQDDPKEGDLFNQTDHDTQLAPSDELVFYVYHGSDALRYAQEHGIRYEIRE